MAGGNEIFCSGKIGGVGLGPTEGVMEPPLGNQVIWRPVPLQNLIRPAQLAFLKPHKDTPAIVP